MNHFWLFQKKSPHKASQLTKPCAQKYPQISSTDWPARADDEEDNVGYEQHHGYERVVGVKVDGVEMRQDVDGDDGVRRGEQRHVQRLEQPVPAGKHQPWALAPRRQQVKRQFEGDAQQPDAQYVPDDRRHRCQFFIHVSTLRWRCFTNVQTGFIFLCSELSLHCRRCHSTVIWEVPECTTTAHNLIAWNYPEKSFLPCKFPFVVFPQRCQFNGDGAALSSSSSSARCTFQEFPKLHTGATPLNNQFVSQEVVPKFSLVFRASWERRWKS